MTDIHCHLFDLYKKNILFEQITEANNAGILNHFSVALTEIEIKWHLKNSHYYEYFYAGIHPNFINEINIETIIQLCEQNKIIAIGEIGFDKRTPNIKKQEKILLQQLEIAQEFELPVIFHNVKMYYELAKLLSKNFPKIKGILHGFNSSEEVFEVFKKKEFAFSINTRFNNVNLLKKILKWGLLFLETDAPFQKPIYDKKSFNSLENLLIPYKLIHKETDQIDAILKNSKKEIFGILQK